MSSSGDKSPPCCSCFGRLNNPGPVRDHGIRIGRSRLIADATTHSAVSTCQTPSRSLTGKSRKMLPITIIILLTLCNQLNPSNGREEEQHSYRENPKPVAPGKNKVLNFGGIFPMTGGWAGGKGCRPAVDMALEDVNSNKNILPGFRLSMSAFDSKVSTIVNANSIILYLHLQKSITVAVCQNKQNILKINLKGHYGFVLSFSSVVLFPDNSNLHQCSPISMVETSLFLYYLILNKYHDMGVDLKKNKLLISVSSYMYLKHLNTTVKVIYVCQKP